jgi:hypothetical protein
MSHSNAVPERGFSINNSMLGKESLSLGEKTIVSLRVVKDAVRIFGCVTKVPITRDLISAAKKAYSEYQLYLDKKRQQEAIELQKVAESKRKEEEMKETQKKKDNIIRLLTEEEERQREQIREQGIAKELIDDASRKLTSAIESNNLQSAKVAQVMLQSGNEKLHDTSKTLAGIQEKIENLRKRLASHEKKTDTDSEPVMKRKKRNT